MSIPFGIYNPLTLNNNINYINNSSLQLSTYSYTFNNTPINSVIYPQLKIFDFVKKYIL